MRSAGTYVTGTFIESTTTSNPLGIDRDPAGPLGTFYYSAHGIPISRVTFPVPIEGLATGGGWIELGGKATFGFNVLRTEFGGPVSGHLEYQNHLTGENVRSLAITDLLVTANSATFGGSCTNNGVACTFQVTVQDNGEPGTADSFRINGIAITPAAGTLKGGNILIHEGDRGRP